MHSRGPGRDLHPDGGSVDNPETLAMAMPQRILSIPGKLMGLAILKAPGLASYRRHLIATWFDKRKSSAFARYVFPHFKWSFFRFEYLPCGATERAAMSDRVMSGASGAAWAENYASKDLPLDAKHPIYAEFNRFLALLDREVTVIQVGSSSGRETHFFATTNPRHRFLGVDIDEAIVAFARRHYHADNLAFAVGRAETVASLLPPPGEPLVVVSSGALQYVQPEFLGAFYQVVASRAAAVVVEDSQSDRLDDFLAYPGSCWWGDFAYNHNHKSYAEAAGLTVAGAVIRRSPHSGGEPSWEYFMVAHTPDFPFPSSYRAPE